METHPGFILAATRTFIFIIRLININNVDIIIVRDNISFCVSNTNFMSVTPGFPHMLIVVSNVGVSFPVTITGQCPAPPSPPMPPLPAYVYDSSHKFIGGVSASRGLSLPPVSGGQRKSATESKTKAILERQ